MSLKQVSSQEANTLMEGEDGALYIDVRTESEFENGHPPNAINIPVVFPDPATRQMLPNPEFMEIYRPLPQKPIT